MTTFPWRASVRMRPLFELGTMISCCEMGAWLSRAVVNSPSACHLIYPESLHLTACSSNISVYHKHYNDHIGLFSDGEWKAENKLGVASTQCVTDWAQPNKTKRLKHSPGRTDWQQINAVIGSERSDGYIPLQLSSSSPLTPQIRLSCFRV